MTDCNITANICVVNLLFVAQNGLNRNGLIEPIETAVSLIIYLLLLIRMIQSTVKIGLVTEIFIPKYQSLFFKLAQLAKLAKLSQKNLGKP